MHKKDRFESLFHAATTGSISELKQCADSIDSWESKFHAKSGDTVLLLAARNGHLHLLTYLIDTCQVDVKQTNFDGKNALHEAAQAGHLQCVQFLIRRGIPVDSIKKADW